MCNMHLFIYGIFLGPCQVIQLRVSPHHRVWETCRFLSRVSPLITSHASFYKLVTGPHVILLPRCSSLKARTSMSPWQQSRTYGHWVSSYLKFSWYMNQLHRNDVILPLLLIGVSLVSGSFPQEWARHVIHLLAPFRTKQSKFVWACLRLYSSCFD